MNWSLACLFWCLLAPLVVAEHPHDPPNTDCCTTETCVATHTSTDTVTTTSTTSSTTTSFTTTTLSTITTLPATTKTDVSTISTTLTVSTTVVFPTTTTVVTTDTTTSTDLSISTNFIPSTTTVVTTSFSTDTSTVTVPDVITSTLQTTTTSTSTFTLLTTSTTTVENTVTTGLTNTLTTTTTPTRTATASTTTTITDTLTSTFETTVTPTVTVPSPPPCATATPYVPGPCASLLASAPNSQDGDYKVTLPGSGVQASVYCAEMSTGKPREYVNLKGGYSRNVDGGTGVTQLTFTKARLLLTNPTAFFIDLYDLTFSSVTVQAADVTAPLSLGEANTCSQQEVEATSLVDITGSDFSFINPIVNFWGASSQHSIFSSTPKQISHGTIGSCAGGILAGATEDQCSDALVPGAIIGPCTESVGTIYNVQAPA
ncbi:hypothetical protein BDK51DRAFT_34926, partial [Blyttiomyces helicus]